MDRPNPDGTLGEHDGTRRIDSAALMGGKTSLKGRSDPELQEVDRPEGEGLEPQPKNALNFYSDVPIGLCYLDLDLRYVQINKWLAAINGLAVKEHIGRTVAEVLPDVARSIEKQLRRVITTGEPIEGGLSKQRRPPPQGLRGRFNTASIP